MPRLPADVRQPKHLPFVAGLAALLPGNLRIPGAGHGLARLRAVESPAEVRAALYVHLLQKRGA